MSNVGKLFEKEFRRFLETRYIVVIHPIDVRGKRFTFKKKFDFIVCDRQGYFIGIECKATGKQSWAFSNVKEHQAENLSLVAGTRFGKAYLALNFRDGDEHGRAWLIPWGWFEDFVKLWHKKSIRRDEAVEQFNGFEMGWDVDKRQWTL